MKKHAKPPAQQARNPRNLSSESSWDDTLTAPIANVSAGIHKNLPTAQNKPLPLYSALRLLRAHTDSSRSKLVQRLLVLLEEELNHPVPSSPIESLAIVT